VLGIESVFGNLGVAFGGSALAGGVTGFAAKKLLKLVIALIGVQLAIFAYLDHQGILDVQWQALDTALAGVHQSLQSVPSWLTAVGATLPIGAGFVGGFLVAFKKF
jgi:uncharacterized membrane protein (Fun14 family)